MKFKAVIESQKLKTIVNASKEHLNDVRINFDKKGLYIVAADPAHIIMVTIAVKKEAFEHFEVGEGRMAIDIGRLEEVIAEASGPIAMELQDAKLLVSYGASKYKIALIDETAIAVDPKIPNLELNSKAFMKNSDLKTLITGCKNILKNGEALFTRSENNLLVDVDNNIEHFQFEIDQEKGEPAETSYPIEYLEDIMKGLPKDAELTMNFKTDYPMLIECPLDTIKIQYILAPRIEEPQ